MKFFGTILVLAVLGSGAIAVRGQTGSCLDSPSLAKQCKAYFEALVLWNQTLKSQASKIVAVLEKLENGSTRLTTVALVFRSAQSAEMAAFTSFARQRVPAPLQWTRERTDETHRLFQLATSSLGKAAARRSTADLAKGNEFLLRLDRLAKRFNEELAQYKEDLDDEKKQRRLTEAVLSEAVRRSLRNGELYATARKVLMADGWTPIKNDEADREHNVVKNLGFTEMDTCSGTGVGYCNFLWEQKDGLVLTVTTVGNDETEGGKPTISGYRID